MSEYSPEHSDAQNAGGSHRPSMPRSHTDEPRRIRGIVRVGPMRASRSTFDTLHDPELRKVFEGESPPDTVIEADNGTAITIVDADVHHLDSKPSLEEFLAFVADIRPRPDVLWQSHGSGGKLVYIGERHRDRAVAAALSLPPFYTVELKTQTRHPGSASSSHGDAHCGGLHFSDQPDGEVHLSNIGRLDPQGLESLLDQLQLKTGGRYDHDRCLVDPNGDSTAKDCVVVLDRGVYCYRCAGKGLKYPGQRSPGFVPFTAIRGGVTTVLQSLVEARVHWRHAVHVLRHMHPNLSEGVLEEAYRLALVEHYGGDDPRIQATFSRDLNVLLSDQGWVDATTWKPTQLDNDLVDAMPAAQDVRRSDDQTPQIHVNRERRSNIKNRTPDGYPPLRRVSGMSFDQDDACIPVVAKEARHRVELLKAPIPEDEAFAHLQRAFPGVDRTYLKACLAAAICAEARRGQPPMLACTGPSGAGKEQHIRLAASFLDEDTDKLPNLEDPAKFNRVLGTATGNGRRFLVLDELGKTRDLGSKFKTLLEIGSKISYVPHYSNGSRQVRMCSAIYMPCVSFPAFLMRSVEFNRRVWAWRLDRSLEDWQVTSGGDTCGWRDRSPENARVANSVLTHVWGLCREHSFQFTKVAGVLGLHRLSDDEGGIDPERLRDLYRFAQSTSAGRVLIASVSTFTRGWIDLDSPAAHHIVDTIVPLDDPDNQRQARTMTKQMLESESWTSILGIPRPTIRCRVKIHGRRWGLRFESCESCLRGQELINDQLPPIPADASSPDDHATVEDPTPAGPDPVISVFRAGGLPI